MLSDYIGKKLEYRQISFFKRHYELKYDEIILVTTQITGFFGQSVIVSIAGKGWEIYKPSFWKSEIAVRPKGYEMPIASFTKKSFGKTGTIELSKGNSLKILFPTFKPKIEIQTAEGIILISIKFKFAFIEKAEILIENKSEILDENPWIIPLVIFVAIENRHRTIAATS